MGKGIDLRQVAAAVGADRVGRRVEDELVAVGENAGSFHSGGWQQIIIEIVTLKVNIPCLPIMVIITGQHNGRELE